MLLYCRSDLVRYTGCAPLLAGIILVVCINRHIVACNINSGSVIDHLLVICRHGIADTLFNTRSKCAHISGKLSIVLVYIKTVVITWFIRIIRIRVIRIHRIIRICSRCILITCKCCQIISPCVDARLAQTSQIVPCQVTALFECFDHAVGSICIIQLPTYSSLGFCTAETVGHEIVSTFCVRKTADIVAFHQLCKIYRAVIHHLMHEIIGIQISIDIQDAECMHIRFIYSKIFRANLISRLVNCFFIGISGDTDLSVCIGKQIADITGPAAHICLCQGIILVCSLVPGDIHCSEHVAEFHCLPIGNRESIKVAQTFHGSAELLILFGDKGCEVCDLRSCDE